METPVPLRNLLTRDVIVASANYSILGLVDIGFRTLQPVFLSTPVALGGLGLDPPVIGTIMSFLGVLNGVCNVFFFSRMADYFGVRTVYLMGVTASVPCFSLFPIINYLARNSVERSGGLGAEVLAAVGLQVVTAVMTNLCYGASAPKKLNYPLNCFRFLPVPAAVSVFIAAAAPNKVTLGATNGLAQLSGAAVRAVGPALVSSIYSLSIDEDHHYMDGALVYYVTVAIGFGAIWVGSLLPRHPWKDMN